MPELPEVEVLRLSLEPVLTGRLIERARVYDPRLREPIDRRRWCAAARGRRVVGLRRRAKYLLIDLEGPNSLVIHLGMSGRLTLVPSTAERERHEHVALMLEGQERLRLRDPRRFGLAFVTRSDALDDDRHFAHLGVEPLSDRFDGAYLRAAARGCRGPVKSFIMDARRVVGVGNIYASEALHRAGIHPTRSVARIAAARWDSLAHAIRAVLERAIEEGGTTLNDFANGLGESGYFQVSLAAYDREGEACGKCEASIRRIVMAGRSTYYCPGCQR